MNKLQMPSREQAKKSLEKTMLVMTVIFLAFLWGFLAATPDSSPVLETAEASSDNSHWQYTEDLPPILERYWEGSVLEGKGQALVDWCQESTIPRVCVKVIAAQTQWETAFGSKGTGAKYKNLTGIRDCGRDGCVWRVYEQYHYSLEDSVRLFIDGNYQDYFTLYGWQDGLGRYLKRWGTNHYWDILNTIYTKLS